MQTDLFPNQVVGGSQLTAAEHSLLTAAYQAVQKGNRTMAHELSTEATRQFPQSVESWLARARFAMSEEECLYSLSQVHRINPNNPAARQETYRVLWHVLEQDPFLSYLDENNNVYVVRNNNYLSMVLPKDRAVPEVYPPVEPDPLTPAFRWLGWALIGMLFAGLGTLVFAPLAILAAVGSWFRPARRGDRIRSLVAIWLALVMLVISVLFVVLFYVHLTG